MQAEKNTNQTAEPEIASDDLIAFGSGRKERAARVLGEVGFNTVAEKHFVGDEDIENNTVSIL